MNGPGPLAPLFVDLTGVYFRPEGLGNTYICGCSPNEVNMKELKIFLLKMNFHSRKMIDQKMIWKLIIPYLKSKFGLY